MSRIGLMVNGQQPMADRIAVAQAAEAAGMSSVWTADGAGDVLITLTAFALNTSRIRIGSGVLVWNRAPVLAAIAAAQIAQLSNDRFILGIGAGPREWNEDWWGIPWDRPIGRMREYVEIVRGAIAADPNAPYSYQGDHFQVRDFVRAFQRTGKAVRPPPIWLGTTGPQMNRLAGRIADGVLINPALSNRFLREVAVPTATVSCVDRAAFTVAGIVSCVVDSDEAAARQRARSSILAQLSRSYFRAAWAVDGFDAEAALAEKRLRAGDVDGARDAISDRFVETVCVAGNADTCQRRLAGILEILDVAVLVVPTYLTGDDQWRIDVDALLAAGFY